MPVVLSYCLVLPPISHTKVHIYDNISPVKEILFYRLNNKSPVEDFLDSLPSKEVQKGSLGVKTGRRVR
jgi:hypothetical protein